MRADGLTLWVMAGPLTASTGERCSRAANRNDTSHAAEYFILTVVGGGELVAVAKPSTCQIRGSCAASSSYAPDTRCSFATPATWDLAA